MLARRLLIGALILAAFAALTEYIVGWATVLAAWRHIDALPLLAALLLTLSSHAARALRVHHYFRPDVAGRLATCLRVSLQHNLVNFLLPMRAGELSFPLLMSRHFAVPATRSVPGLLWFRVLDLHLIALIGVAALLAPLLPTYQVALLLLAWLAAPPLLVHFNRRLSDALRARQPGRGRDLALELLQALPADYRLAAGSWTWTGVIWAVKLSASAWVFLQFLAVGAERALLAAIAGDVSGVLPVHGVAGTGTYEAAVVAVLLPFGVEAGAALAAAINLHIFLLSTALCAGLLSFALPAGEPRTAGSPT